MQQLLPGLWRWTARHPAWNADGEPGGVDDWPEEVGCVAYAAPRTLVLVDPLVEDEAFLDDLVAEQDQPVSILQTIGFHGRSREALERRYADRLAPEPGPGVEPVPIAGAGETMVWLPEPRALVPATGCSATGEAGCGCRPTPGWTT
jgi:hypothetical protein